MLRLRYLLWVEQQLSFRIANHFLAELPSHPSHCFSTSDTLRELEDYARSFAPFGEQDSVSAQTKTSALLATLQKHQQTNWRIFSLFLWGSKFYLLTSFHFPSKNNYPSPLTRNPHGYPSNSQHLRWATFTHCIFFTSITTDYYLNSSIGY